MGWVDILVHLSSLINKAAEGGFISGFRAKGMGREEMLITLFFFFADDTLVLCGLYKSDGASKMGL